MTSPRWRGANISRWLDADATRVDVAQMTSRVTSTWTWEVCVAHGMREALTQKLQAARESACRLRWLRGFHRRVDRFKTISVIPSEMWSEQYSRRDSTCSDLCGVGLLSDSGYRFGTRRQWLEDVGGSTARGCSDCCDGGSDVESGVTPIKTRLLRKGQSSGSDTMLKILNNCIVFHNQRIYMCAFI